MSLQVEDVAMETAVRLLAEQAGMKVARIDNVLYVTTPEQATSIAADNRAIVPNYWPYGPLFPAGGGVGVVGGVGAFGLGGAAGASRPWWYWWRNHGRPAAVGAPTAAPEGGVEAVAPDRQGAVEGAGRRRGRSTRRPGRPRPDLWARRPADQGERSSRSSPYPVPRIRVGGRSRGL